MDVEVDKAVLNYLPGDERVDVELWTSVALTTQDNQLVDVVMIRTTMWS